MKGFTIIELMIVVAVLGILAAIALPAYQDALCKENLEKCKVNMPTAYNRIKNKDNPPENESDEEKLTELVHIVRELQHNSKVPVSKKPQQQSQSQLIDAEAPDNVKLDYVFTRNNDEELVLKRHRGNGYLYACHGKKCTKVKESK